VVGADFGDQPGRPQIEIITTIEVPIVSSKLTKFRHFWIGLWECDKQYLGLAVDVFDETLIKLSTKICSLGIIPSAQVKYNAFKISKNPESARLNSDVCGTSKKSTANKI
jgi:hypothetical protein